MIIWFSLIIPIICIIYLYSIKQFRKKVLWWETTSLMMISVIFIFLMKLIIETTQTSDTEYLQDIVVSAKHYDYWNEYIHKTCEDCSTDSKGNTHCKQYDCSEMVEYAPYTELITKYGKVIHISEGYKPFKNTPPDVFNRLCKQFSTTAKKISTKESYIHEFYGKNCIGNEYEIFWNKKIETIEPITWSQSYENRIQASNNIQRYVKPDTSEISFYELFEYPKLFNYKQQCILGINNSKLDRYANQRNAYIAPIKQLKVYYLIFKNKSEQAALMQQRYWGGGNKNEVVICIGIDDNNSIDWSYVFSWSEVETFKINIRNFINSKEKLSETNFLTIIDETFDILNKEFVRYRFENFKYISVEPPTWSIILTFIINTIISIAYSIFIVKNRHF